MSISDPNIIAYLAANKVNGKRYIGITSVGLKARISRHLSTARRGGGWRLHAAIRKHGEDNFAWEILQSFPDIQAAKKFEIAKIKELNPEYNVTSGGDGRRSPMTEAARRALSKARKGVPGTFLGRKHQDSSKEKMRAAAIGRPGWWTGKKRSPEDVAAMVAGRTSPNRYWLNKKRPPETCAKISASKMGGSPPKETPLMRESRAANMRRAANNRKKSVQCKNDGKVFPSKNEAADFYNLNRSSVYDVASGRRRSVNGFEFSFYEAP